MVESLSTRMFTYIPEKREFVAEASTLRMKVGTAIPTVMTLVSHKTGKHEQFELDYIQNDGTLEYLASNDALQGVKVTIFND